MPQIIFLVVIAVIVLAIIFARWFANAPTAQASRALRIVGALLILLLALFLAVRGQLMPALFAASAALPLLLRLKAARNRARTVGGPSAGQGSSVESVFLRMDLDHDSGEMDGEIIAGRHQGQRLSALEREPLIALYQGYLADDQDSARLLAAYLDRRFGPDWRDMEPEAPSSHGHMTREEAAQILGIAEDASDDEIRRAHRALMQRNHPDHGGSGWLAAKINQAKEVLLSR